MKALSPSVQRPGRRGSARVAVMTSATALELGPLGTTTGEGPADPDAILEERVRSHMALVGHIVRESMGRLPGHVSRDDLTSAGLTALVQAAKSYDESRGVPF